MRGQKQQLLVRATRTGYHEHGRRRTGTEFYMNEEDIVFDKKSGQIVKPTWVEILDQPEPIKRPRGPMTNQGNAAVSRPANGVSAPLPNPAPKQPQADDGADDEAGDDQQAGTDSDKNVL